ncbi:MAG TPA: fibronectin type III domain-containing protein, partial [Tepidisphaeraceae bacterium]
MPSPSSRANALRRAAVSVVETLEQRKMFAAAPTQIAINFGPFGSEAHGGYLTDSGEAYGTQQFGIDYGWNTAIAQSNAFERSASKPQKLETGINTASGNGWKIAIPNGTYRVKLVAGDANVTSGTYSYKVGDSTTQPMTLSGTAGAGDARWITATGEVTVTDGFLTISDNNGTRHGLAYVEIVKKSDRDSTGIVGAPDDVKATARLSNGVDIRWVDNANNEDFDGGYEIERRNVATNAVTTLVTDGGIRQHHVDFQGLAASTTYQYKVRAKRTNASGIAYSAWSTTVSVTTPATNAQAAYGGVNTSVPTGIIQAENYDRGAAGDAFSDLSGANAGGFYRAGSTDIGLRIFENIYYVGWVKSTEWQEYTVDVEAAGTYYIDARVSSKGTGGTWNMMVGGIDKFTSNLPVGDTGSFGTYQTQGTPTFTLGAGNGQIFRFNARSENAAGSYPAGTFVGNFDSFTVQRFDAPSSLASTAVSASRVDLSWTSNASSPSAFLIERKLGSGAWTQIAAAAGTATSYQDTSVTGGQSYTYRVRAQRPILGTSPEQFGTTPYSGESTAVTPQPQTVPAAPSSLAATVSAGNISLTWADNATNELGYYVLRKLTTSSWPAEPITPYDSGLLANATSYTDTAAAAGQSYDYRIVAYNSIGRSAASNLVTAAIPASTTTTDVGPVADAHVRNGIYAGNNYGSASPLEVKVDSTDFTREALVKYDLTAYDNASQVKLQFNALRSNTQPANVTLNVRPISSTSWTESGVTWNTKPAYGATLGTVVVSAITSSPLEVDVTPYVQAELAAGRKTISFAIVGSVTNVNHVHIQSKEGGAGPLLRVTSSATQLPPAAPSNLTVTATTSTSVALSWSDNATTETAYRIERRVSGTSAFTVLTPDLAANTTSFTDASRDEGVQYDYQVRAVNSAGTSSPAGPAQAWTKLAAPTSVTAASASSTSIAVTWADNSANETSYALDYSTSSTFAAGVATVSSAANTQSRLLTGLTAGATYYVRVRALGINADVTSDNSAVATNATLGSLQISHSPSGSPSEGTSIILTASYTGGAAPAGTTYSWIITRNGQSFATGSGTTFSFNAVDDGAYAASVTASTGDTATQAFGVVNVAPTLTATGSTTATTGQAYALDLTATDPGTADTITWTIDWGDGTISTPTGRTLAPAHTYASAGNYTIAISASDGAATANPSPASISVAVTAAVTVPGAPSSLAVTAATSNSVSLSWADNSANEDGFRIERALHGSTNFAIIGTVAAG